MCKDWWIVPLFCVWAFIVTLVIVLSQDILKINETILLYVEGNRSNEETKNKAMSRVESGETELKSAHDIDVQSCDTKVKSCDTDVRSLQDSSSMRLNKTQGREIDTSQARVPILWGALNIRERRKHRDIWHP